MRNFLESSRSPLYFHAVIQCAVEVYQYPYWRRTDTILAWR